MIESEPDNPDEIAELIVEIATQLKVQAIEMSLKDHSLVIKYPQSEFDQAVDGWKKYTFISSNWIVSEGCNIEINCHDNAKGIYKSYLDYEFTKNPYEYVLLSYRGASDALVDYIERSNKLTYDAFSDWVNQNASSLEPQLLLYKSAKDFLFSKTQESLSWYWFGRLRICSDVKKANAQNFLELEGYGLAIMKNYLGEFFDEWKNALSLYTLHSLKRGLDLFLEHPISYKPNWVSKTFSTAECGQVLKEEEWLELDQQIANEFGSVLPATGANISQERESLPVPMCIIS